jgi:hypothetical protein
VSQNADPQKAVNRNCPQDVLMLELKQKDFNQLLQFCSRRT